MTRLPSSSNGMPMPVRSFDERAFPQQMWCRMRAGRCNASALRAGLSLFAIVVMSCGGGGDLPTQPGGGGALVTQIVITPDGGTIVAGQTATFAAQAKDASGNPVSQTLTWSVADASIASVSQGVVTGRAPGK